MSRSGGPGSSRGTRDQVNPGDGSDYGAVEASRSAEPPSSADLANRSANNRTTSLVTPQRAGTSPGPESYYAVRSGQAAAKRMILWPGPSTRAQPARAEPLPVQSIKQPQLDLHSRLHNPGTYRVKAPGRDPLYPAGAEEAGKMSTTRTTAPQRNPRSAGDTRRRGGCPVPADHGDPPGHRSTQQRDLARLLTARSLR
jgi:hypothetical protein